MKITSIAHFLAGIATPILTLINPAIPIAVLIMFLLYEYIEYKLEGDNMYKDISEFLIGSFTSSITIIYLIYSGVIR